MFTNTTKVRKASITALKFFYQAMCNLYTWVENQKERTYIKSLSQKTMVPSYKFLFNLNECVILDSYKVI